MSAVAFHTGVVDPVDHACRLLRKVQRQGLRVKVEAPSADLERLDHALWVFDPQSFLPHVRLRPGQDVPLQLARTPVWLMEAGAHWPARCPAPELLVRWGLVEAADARAWARVIEIVSEDAADRQAARRRWRAYEAAGADLQHHTA
jgi:DNA polymerase-3 subunit chi